MVQSWCSGASGVRVRGACIGSDTVGGTRAFAATLALLFAVALSVPTTRAADGASAGRHGHARGHAHVDAGASAATQASHGAVLNERLDITWLGPRTIVYRRETGRGAGRFVLVDGSREQDASPPEAFDHVAVAARLVELGLDGDADDVPIVRLALHADDDTRLLGLTRDGRVVSLRRRGSDVRLEDDARLTAFTLPPARGRRSRNDGGGGAEIIVVNRSDSAITLEWLDHGGATRPYGVVAPGATRRQSTHPGHLWSVRSDDGRAVGRYRATRGIGVIVVGAGDASAVEGGASGGEPRRDEPFGDEPTRGMAPSVADPAARAVFPPVPGRADVSGPTGATQVVGRTDARTNGSAPSDGPSAVSPVHAATDASTAPSSVPLDWRPDVVDHDLVLRHPDGRVLPLTDDGTSSLRYRGPFHWSPDRRYVLAYQEAPAQEHLVHIVESSPRDQVQPRLISFQYLKPGDAITRRWPVLFAPGRALAAEDERVAETADARIPIHRTSFDNPWAIDHVRWAPSGTRVTFRYNQRGHGVLRLLSVDAATGRVTTVTEDKPGTFVDYAQKGWFRYLDDPAGGDGHAIFMTERSGWNHLMRVDLATGATKSLTDGQWVVRAVDEVDLERRTLRFRAMGVHPDQDPYHVHHGRVSLDGGPITWLTEGDGTHELDFGPDGALYVDRWSRVDLPPVHELRDARDGSLVTRLETADWSGLLATGWRPPERFVAQGRDGETPIWGIIHRPTGDAGDAESRGAAPVVETIYAGPHGHFVPKAFRRRHGAARLTELGFVVVQIDGMGTNWRSKSFHDVCWQNLGDSGFPDRIAWMRAAAAERPWMDLDRVGIIGGSAGGQSAVRALIAHGDFYDVAVADCGCHDNRMDKIWWNELWMGWPIGPHYDEQSNVTQAHRITGDLLLIVGELDRNVDPASTMQVVDALIRANRDFDLLVIPGAGHGAAGTSYGRQREEAFLVEHLGPDQGTPPASNRGSGAANR